MTEAQVENWRPYAIRVIRAMSRHGAIQALQNELANPQTPDPLWSESVAMQLEYFERAAAGEDPNKTVLHAPVWREEDLLDPKSGKPVTYDCHVCQDTGFVTSRGRRGSVNAKRCDNCRDLRSRAFRSERPDSDGATDKPEPKYDDRGWVKPGEGLFGG